MKCLLKYQWVKLLRAHLPQGKGVMGYWARLAARAAFRKGEAHYCGSGISRYVVRWDRWPQEHSRSKEQNCGFTDFGRLKALGLY